MLTAVDSADALLMPDTETGIELFEFESLPNWPKLFLPQHFAAPLAMSAQEDACPALTLTALVAAVAPEILDTSTGTGLSVVVPSPNWP